MSVETQLAELISSAVGLTQATNLKKAELDSAVENLASTSDAAGASLVGYDGGTVQDVLDKVKSLTNYTTLRAYTGRATGVQITDKGIAGFFQRDTTDTTSADNGGTIIVDASNRRWKRLFVGPVNIKWFGAKGDGVTNDAVAEDNAHAANAGKAVIYPASSQEYLNVDSLYNMYGATANRHSLTDRVVAGLPATPATETAPVSWIQKVGSVDRQTTEWDQGAAYMALIKKGGSAPGVAATIYGLHQGSAQSSMIGLHARVKMQSNANSDAWAGWFYTDVDQEGVRAAHGLEVNGFINPARSNFVAYLGKLQLCRLVMADNIEDNNRFSTALSVGRNTHGGNNNGFWTGVHIEAGSIVSSNLDTDNGEVFRADGPVYSGQKIGGIRFVSGADGTLGTYRYGLKTTEATFSNNNVIHMATAQCIRWGDSTTGPRVLGGSNNVVVGNGFLNISDPVSGTALQVAGVKVLGARETGWAADTGTAKKTANADYTATAEVSYTQATIQALMDATRDNRRTIKAVKDLLISHGLAGA